MPALTVIVPCYNAEKTVRRALDSLRQQTLTDMEVLVINDGSTDATLAVLEQYQKDYPAFVMRLFSKPNEGIAAARNFGLDHVETPYFGFLDSDDYAEPDMFRTLLDKAVQEDLPIVVSPFYWTRTSGETKQEEGPYETGPEMMVHLFAVLWNKIYNTAFVKRSGVRFPDGDRYEDACFLYCLTMFVERIGFVDKPFVHYVQGSASITHTNNEQVKNMIDVFERIFAFYRAHGKYEEYRDALEYITIKFFLGNSFLRSARIQDSQDRQRTIRMGWDLLNREFPEWPKNPYLKSLGGMKNRYFSLVRSWNLSFFAWLFRHFAKERL